MEEKVLVENPAKLKNIDLAKTLDRLGIENTWKSIIRTHIHKNNPGFNESIGNSEEFSNGHILDQDFIHNLTLGETSILYEFSLAHVNHASRKKEGQYFTPDDVAFFLAQKSAFFPEGVWLDVCSGIGNLSHWLTQRQENPEHFILNNLKLIDRDPLALLVARALFAIHFQHSEENIFGRIKENFIVQNVLDDEPLPQHDYVILNPPYVASTIDERFQSAKARDLYAYTVEKIATSSKGFISITPQSYTNSSKFSGFRKMLMDTQKAFDIYVFDNIPDPIFRGVKFGSQNTNTVNSTRASVIVANPASKDGYRITPMLRWKSSQRAMMLDTAHTFLTSFTPTSDLYPKLDKGLKPLYDELVQSNLKTVKDYVSLSPTEHKLIVPTTPRYFISASRRKLERSSFKELHFKDKETADRMYLLLNSSLLYWWWRVNDGGMTLSGATLFSLPVLDSITVDDALVKRLEQSEQDNLVVKLNAGKPNENIKHPMDLIADLNSHLVPNYAVELLKTHRNSYFG